MTDLWDDPNLSFSKLVLNWLLRADDRMLTSGFNKNLISEMECDIDKEELSDLLNRNNIIPDAYVIDIEIRTAYIFEVEDTHPIKPDKLRKLSEIWCFLDALDWEIRVFCIDRYMDNWRVVPLSKVWYTLKFEDNSKRKKPKNSVPKVEVNWEEKYQSIKRNHILGDDGWI